MSGWLVVLYIIGCVGFWFLTLLTWPGNWGLLIYSGIFAAFTAGELTPRVSWWMVLGTFVLALLGELAETLGAAKGLAKEGSARTLYLALFGAFFGSIAGVAVGAPIPILGSVVGALLGGAGGALLGAVVGARWSGATWQASWEQGKLAFRGRLLGSFAKIACGTLILLLLIVGLWIS